MSDYLMGCDVLGATTDAASVLNATLRANPNAVVHAPAQDPNDFATRKRNGYIVLGLFAAGVLGAGAGGALLWKAHRGFGFLLGSFLVGPMIGGTAATLYGMSKKVEL